VNVIGGVGDKQRQIKRRTDYMSPIETQVNGGVARFLAEAVSQLGIVQMHPALCVEIRSRGDFTPLGRRRQRIARRDSALVFRRADKGVVDQRQYRAGEYRGGSAGPLRILGIYPAVVQR